MSLTIGRAFLLAMACLTLLLGALFWLVLEESRQSIIQSSDRLRDMAGKRIETLVKGYLDQAPEVVTNVEQQLQHGIVRADDTAALEASLYAQLLAHPNITELTLTRASGHGFNDQGLIVLSPEGRDQISVFRAEGQSGIQTRRTVSENGRYQSQMTWRDPRQGLGQGKHFVEAAAATDPTEHLTFQTPTSRDLYGQLLPTDLAYTQLDDSLPEEKRRVTVSVLKALEDRRDHFVGVIRAGLLTERIDQITQQLKINEGDPNDPHRIFICDNKGRLITHLAPDDHLALMNEDGKLDPHADDLRVVPSHVPTEVAQALRQEVLKGCSTEHPQGACRIRPDGQSDYLVTFRHLKGTQDWIVGIVVPESYYLGELVATRNRLLAASLGIMLFIVVGGGITLRVIRRGLSQVVSETTKMRNFDFTASESRSSFRDLAAALESLELAKTALRAMGKYVPIDLVRQLYHTGQEPGLGSELRDVSVMFTDIKNFTTVSEQLSPNVLAQALGQYLEIMTVAIQHTDGVIDKFIGDAIMALWNAPRSTPDHALKACRAALDCMAAAEQLYASPAWTGLPPWTTRFGLHCDEVNVGHFGAPNRISFTAVGDGVNLASRLEGLNKQYGTRIMVSQSIYEVASGEFEFRMLDRVAVKGKTRGVQVYELLGARDSVSQARRDVCRTYEKALNAYFQLDFETARALLADQREADPPSQVLFHRCELMAQQPPDPDWDGIYISTMK